METVVRLDLRRVLILLGFALAAVFTAMFVAVGATYADTELVDSELVVSTTGAFVHGDASQFKQRQRIDDNAIGGIEKLYMEWLTGEDGTLRLQGRAIAGNNDYLLKLDYDAPDKAFVSAGYREFRAWSDGSGGFFPPSATFISLFDQDLSLDRGQAWLEAGLRVPDLPELTLRYDHFDRSGKKDSTSWGSTDLTGGLGARAIAPTFLDIDEQRDIVDLRVSDTLARVADTEVGLGLRYESTAVDNSRNIRQQPGQVGLDRFVTQRDRTSSDLYNLHAYSRTAFAENRAVFSSAYSYAELDNDLGGSRIYGNSFGAAFDPAYSNRQPLDSGMVGLGGRSRLRRHTGSLNFLLRPRDSLRVIAAVRGEAEDINGISGFSDTLVLFPPTLATIQTPLAVSSASDTRSYAESLELRYSGLRNLVVYARGDWEQEDGSLREIETNTSTAVVDVQRDTDSNLNATKYTAGAVWYPHRRVSVTGRFSYGSRDRDYRHSVDSTADPASSNQFPAFIRGLKLDERKGNLRLAWRALDVLRVTLRYDIGLATVDNSSGTLAEVESADVRSDTVGAAATWSPSPSSYVQGDIGYTSSRTDTPADSLGGSAAGLVTDFDNDYWNAVVSAGLALDEHTDLSGRYFFYRASNYKNNSSVSQPFGSDAEEHGVSVSVKRKLSDNTRAGLRYGFFSNNEGLTGGRNDYNVSVISGTMEVSFQ